MSSLGRRQGVILVTCLLVLLMWWNTQSVRTLETTTSSPSATLSNDEETQKESPLVQLDDTPPTSSSSSTQPPPPKTGASNNNNNNNNERIVTADVSLSSNLDEVTRADAQFVAECLAAAPPPNHYICRKPSTSLSCDSRSDRGITKLYSHHEPTRNVPDYSHYDHSPGKYNDYGVCGCLDISCRDALQKHVLGDQPCESPPTDEERVQSKREREKYFEWRWSPEVEKQICEDRTHSKYFSMRRIGAGYGLTNQLIALTGAFAMALRTNRIAVLDGSSRIPFSKMLNLSTTVFPPGLRVVRDCGRLLPRPLDVTKGIADKKIQAVDRKNVAKRPHKVVHRIDAYFFPSTLPHARYIELYMRYPFEQEANMDASIGALMCGLQFVDRLVLPARKIMAYLREQSRQEGARRSTIGVGGTVTASAQEAAEQQPQQGESLVDDGGRGGGYVALHLRMEKSDAIAMRKQRRQSTPAQLEAFMRDTIVPLMKSHSSISTKETKQRHPTTTTSSSRVVLSDLVVCAGELDEWVWDALRRAASPFGIRVHNKLDVLQRVMPEFGGFNDFNTTAPTEREGDQWIRPTLTDAAIVDALLLEHATVTIMTTTSSLTSLIYAKRCGGGAAPQAWSPRAYDRATNQRRTHFKGCAMRGSVYLYDVYLDGTFTQVMRYPCGVQFGQYLVAPPVWVPRAPPKIQVWAMRYKHDSVLFTNRSRNEGDRRIPREGIF